MQNILKMIRSDLLRLFKCPYRRNFIIVSARDKTSSLDIEKLENESVSTVDVIDEEHKAREAEIELKRNKSRLKEPDRNFLFEQNPYPEPQRWQHGTLKYMRRLYGRYGEASGVAPAICWPVKEELEDAIEYERVAFPHTIPQMVEDAKTKRREKEEAIRIRQESIVKNMEKLEDMKRELHNRIKKKEGDAVAAKERKERLIEEVRMHFGYTVDPRDDKFKEMLEKKEKEQKKAMKQAKQKARDQQILTKLLSKKTGASEKTDDNVEK